MHSSTRDCFQTTSRADTRSAGSEKADCVFRLYVAEKHEAFLRGENFAHSIDGTDIYLIWKDTTHVDEED